MLSGCFFWDRKSLKKFEIYSVCSLFHFYYLLYYSTLKKKIPPYFFFLPYSWRKFIILELTWARSVCATSRWLLREARWSAVKPSSLGSLTEQEGGRWVRMSLMAPMLPRRAAWCRQLKPLLLVAEMSACASTSSCTMSSRFLEMASWRGVSPSRSCKLQGIIRCHLNFTSDVLQYMHQTIS